MWLEARNHAGLEVGRWAQSSGQRAKEAGQTSDQDRFQDGLIVESVIPKQSISSRDSQGAYIASLIAKSSKAASDVDRAALGY